jgi:hypothetical protein
MINQLLRSMDVYEVRPRKDHRGVDLIFRCAAIRRSVVRRAECGQQRNRLRDASQPLMQCCDPRVRCRWQRDRNARARGRFQRVLGK